MVLAQKNQPSGTRRGSVDDAEIARFSALAETWWDSEGPMRALHRLNPVRLGVIRDYFAAQAGRDPLAPRPLDRLRLLDVGCGGGLVCEPLSRLGADVVGIDAAESAIRAARHHAEGAGLAVDYREATAEALADAGERFDGVLALEIVEHVADLDLFLSACASLIRPGGGFVGATLNRTPQAYAFAVVGAEYVMRWLPRGTHDWSKFVRPSEFVNALRHHGVTADALSGVRYRPMAGAWALSDDLSVNYMIAGHRDA